MCVVRQRSNRMEDRIQEGLYENENPKDKIYVFMKEYPKAKPIFTNFNNKRNY